jgi:RHS repeat-associated protein
VQSVSEPGPAGALVSTYTYPDATTVAITSPNGSTSINKTYLDGRPKSLTGSAQAPVYYEYQANATGLLTRTGHQPPTGSAADQTLGWTEVQTDLLGREIRRSTPAFGWPANSGQIVNSWTEYDSTTGKMTIQRTPLGTGGGSIDPSTELFQRHLYFYGPDGRLARDGLDVNGNRTLDDVSSDRFSAYDTAFSKDSTGWIRTDTTRTGIDSTQGLNVTSAKTATRLTGLAYGNGSFTVSDVTKYDASGRAFKEVTQVTPSTQTAVMTTTAGGVTTAATRTSINGYLASTTSASGVVEQYSYDSLGRLQSDSWRYNGGTFQVGKSLTYFGNTAYIKTSTESNSTHTFGYSWGTDGTRTVSDTDSLGHTTYTRYNSLGLLYRTWGDATNPVEIGYDSLGRRTTLTTWRSGNFASATWPTSPGSGDRTQWTIEAATGLVTRQTFPDANHVDFTYTALGQVKTRTWARLVPNSTNRVTTTYTYFDGNLAGYTGIRTQELYQVSYNDGTPSVTYLYKRSGQTDKIGDATGTTSFSYRTTDGQLDYTDLGQYYNNKRLTVGYETGASVGRPYQLSLGDAQNPSSIWNYAVGYAGSGRMATVSGTSLVPAANGTGNVAGTPIQFAIDYVPYSDKVAAVRQDSLGYRVAKTYESNRDVVQQSKTTFGGSTIAAFDYQYDSALNETSAAKTGTVFSGYGSGIVTKYAFTNRSELQSETTYIGTDPAAVGTALAGRTNSAMVYDNMGNRATVTRNGQTVAYAADANNQYTSRQNPSTSSVSGMREANAPVAVGSTLATVQNGYYWASPAISNASGPAPANLYVSTDPAAQNQIRQGMVPSASETLVYDADGNLTDDSLWHYTYDAENRLSGMTTSSAAVQAGAPSQRHTYYYDYRNRRVSKQVDVAEASGFLGQYYSAGMLAGAAYQTRVDSGLDFTWAAGSRPASVCWTASLLPPATGNYQLKFTTDSTFCLWVDGQLVQQATTKAGSAIDYITAQLALTAGRRVTVQIVCPSGPGRARLQWQGPGYGWSAVAGSAVGCSPLAAGGSWRTMMHRYYLYDGDNLIAEYNGARVERTFTWGLDMSDTRQGAGGVGGLLMTAEAGANYLPVCDRRGSVHGMLRADTGELAAVYEYNAHGEIIRQAGGYAGTNPFGWCTKVTDRETNLVYFGRRFYSPTLGRFVNRDPIGTDGGWNLHAYCRGNPVCSVDYMGLATEPPWNPNNPIDLGNFYVNPGSNSWGFGSPTGNPLLPNLIRQGSGVLTPAQLGLGMYSLNFLKEYYYRFKQLPPGPPDPTKQGESWKDRRNPPSFEGGISAGSIEAALGLADTSLSGSTGGDAGVKSIGGPDGDALGSFSGEMVEISILPIPSFNGKFSAGYILGYNDQIRYKPGKDPGTHQTGDIFDFTVKGHEEAHRDIAYSEFRNLLSLYGVGEPKFSIDSENNGRSVATITLEYNSQEAFTQGIYTMRKLIAYGNARMNARNILFDLEDYGYRLPADKFQSLQIKYHNNQDKASKIQDELKGYRDPNWKGAK